MSLRDIYRQMLEGHDDTCMCEFCEYYRKPEVIEAFKQIYQGESCDEVTLNPDRVQCTVRVDGDARVPSRTRQTNKARGVSMKIGTAIAVAAIAVSAAACIIMGYGDDVVWIALVAAIAWVFGGLLG